MSSDRNPSPLRIGDVFLGKYHVLEVMGRGGFGFVYRARSEFMGREVAIKVLAREGSPEAISRGQQEAVILGKLKHSNIVEIYDADISPEGQLYIIMELLRGKTLAERLRDDGPFDVGEGLRVLEALCGAIGTAHGQGIFHRDIKPANIFLCDDGTPKMLDFGIAKMAGSTGVRTAPNMVVGTSLYVSPEQLHAQTENQGKKPAPALSDIYSMGLVAFQMFHGQHPLVLVEPDANFRNPTVVWRLHVQTRAPVLDEVLPGFPSAVAQLVRTAMAKDPGNRLPSMTEFAKKAKIARLQYLADESEAEFEPIPGRSSPLPEARGSQLPEISTRPLERRSTRKLFQDVPEASLDRFSDRASSAPTRYEKTGVDKRAVTHAGDTPEPASRTIDVPSTPESPARGRSDRTGILMALAGLVLGMGGMIWADPFGALDDPDDSEPIMQRAPSRKAASAANSSVSEKPSGLVSETVEEVPDLAREPVVEPNDEQRPVIDQVSAPAAAPLPAAKVKPTPPSKKSPTGPKAAPAPFPVKQSEPISEGESSAAPSEVKKGEELWLE